MYMVVLWGTAPTVNRFPDLIDTMMAAVEFVTDDKTSLSKFSASAIRADDSS
jgi:hypothetical protein